jgi:hypothetical protein
MVGNHILAQYRIQLPTQPVPIDSVFEDLFSHHYSYGERVVWCVHKGKVRAMESPPAVKITIKFCCGKSLLFGYHTGMG